MEGWGNDELGNDELENGKLEEKITHTVPHAVGDLGGVYVFSSLFNASVGIVGLTLV